LGVEADVSRNNGGDWGLGTNDGSFGDGLFRWSGTARGRIGFVTNNILLFGTGGFAWSDAKLTRVQIGIGNPNAPPATVETASATRTGWTAGGGVEVGVTPDLSVKAEYGYIDYGTFSVAFPLQNRTWYIDTRSRQTLNNSSASSADSPVALSSAPRGPEQRGCVSCDTQLFSSPTFRRAPTCRCTRKLISTK